MLPDPEPEGFEKTSEESDRDDLFDDDYEMGEKDKDEDKDKESS